MSILKQLETKRIVVCCGSGGVGKTTVSAAIGMHGAASGRKTIVLTIDPAKRLADALGMTRFDHLPQRVPGRKLKELDLHVTGQLSAMMLNTKRTFDRLIDRYIPDRKAREAVFNNRYYQHISSTLAGSHEYMAMEKLYEIYHEGKYDLIVIDTPPSRNALDFLEAPRRMSNLFGNNLFWKIVKPYVKTGLWGMKMFSLFTSPIQRMAGNLIGAQVFEDLSAFFQLGDDVFFDGFRKRSQEVMALLSCPETVFLAIASPMYITMREARFLYERLETAHIPFGGFIINRVHRSYPDPPVITHEVSDRLSRALNVRLIENYSNFQEMGKSDRSAVKALKDLVGSHVPIEQIPRFDDEVHDLKGLVETYLALKSSESH